MILTTNSGFAQEGDTPKGFTFNNPDNFVEHPNFHGGAGKIRYSEYWGSDNYVTLLQFMRVVVIPPKCSLDEYRSSLWSELW